MTIFTLASITSSPAVRRRLTLLGALCMLTSLLPIVYPSLFTSSINAQSQLRNSQVFQVGSIRMEAANDKIVPSIVVYVTVPNKDAGKKLAGSIVKEKLAACVNRVPGIESVYLWQGEIQTDSEELLIIKTRESLLDALTEHVKANHEYEVAEVIALPITGGSLPYLEWLKNSTRD